jgi:hypothetical protein
VAKGDFDEWDQSLVSCLVHEMTSAFDFYKERLVNEGKFSDERALKILNKAISGASEYWMIEGKVHPIGMGRQTDYLGLVLEEVFKPRNLEVLKG